MIIITIYQNTKRNLDQERCIEYLCFLSKPYFRYILYCQTVIKYKHDDFMTIPILLLYQIFHFVSRTISKVVNEN